MRNKIITQMSLLLATVIMSMSVSAIPLLSNLGSPVNGGFGGSPDSADNFITGNVDLTINDIDLRWTTGNGATNRIGIFADVAGLPGITQIGGWFTSAVATTGNTIINYIGNAVLTANTSYWMVADISDGSRASYTFNQSVFSDASTMGADIIGPFPGSAFGNDQTGNWNSDPANLMYALNGTANTNAVPEPGSLALLGIGLLGMGMIRRKNAQ